MNFSPPLLSTSNGVRPIAHGRSQRVSVRSCETRPLSVTIENAVVADTKVAPDSKRAPAQVYRVG